MDQTIEGTSNVVAEMSSNGVAAPSDAVADASVDDNSTSIQPESEGLSKK